MGIGTASAQAATCVFYLGTAIAANALGGFVVPAAQPTFFNGLFVVLQPGDELRVTNFALAAAITVTGFGAELEGVAD